jgi:hypothetical protein
MTGFRRPYHRAVASLLDAMDAAFLARAECWFGGGTQIALSLGEYRESRDIDFLCSSRKGFRLLRETVTENSLGALARRPISLARELRIDRDGIRGFLNQADTRIKFEIVLEARIDLSGCLDKRLGVPVLSSECVAAEKFLANADRGLDTSTSSRDLIDLAFLAAAHGMETLEPGLRLAESAYGKEIRRRLSAVLMMFESRRGYVSDCARSLGIEDVATLRRGLKMLRSLKKGKAGGRNGTT